MYFCEECGDVCAPHIENQGLGKYEFWGAELSDDNFVLVSPCCDAAVLNEDGDEVSASEFRADEEDARGDYLHDCARDAKWDDEHS